MKRLSALLLIVALAIPTTGSAQTSPTTHPREVHVSFETTRHLFDFGDAIVFRGALTPTSNDVPQECVAHRDILIERVIAGEMSTQTVTAAISNADGTFKEVVRADAGSYYVARVEDSSSCPGSVSAGEPVRVHPRLRIKQDGYFYDDPRTPITSVVRPCDFLRDTSIVLQRYDGERFVRASSDRTVRGSCTPTFAKRLGSDTVFRILWRKQHPAFERAHSHPAIVRPLN